MRKLNKIIALSLSFIACFNLTLVSCLNRLYTIDEREGEKLYPLAIQRDSFIIPNSDIVIERDGEYFKKEEVAAYVMYYKKMPKNYFKNGGASIKVCKEQYPDTCMLYGTEVFTNAQGILPLGFSYREMDLYMYDDSYPDSSGNRGSLRLVYTVSDENVENHAIYYTNDHYDSFVEYKNYYKGWTTEPWFKLKDKKTLSVGSYVIEDGVTITYDEATLTDIKFK